MGLGHGRGVSMTLLKAKGQDTLQKEGTIESPNFPKNKPSRGCAQAHLCRVKSRTYTDN